jgi:hypothetical protein
LQWPVSIYQKYLGLETEIKINTSKAKGGKEKWWDTE